MFFLIFANAIVNVISFIFVSVNLDQQSLSFNVSKSLPPSQILKLNIFINSLLYLQKNIFHGACASQGNHAILN